MEFNIGDEYQEKFIISSEVVDKFAKFSQDYNPMHTDSNFAKNHGYAHKVSHGVIQLSYLSKISKVLPS